MPIGTCDPATRGDTFNQTALERPLPNRSGSVLVDIRWAWDGVSVRPSCNGPVQSLRVRNNGTQTAWAVLPNKKRAPLWVQIDPGVDTTTSSPGQLTNLGLSDYLDVIGVNLVFDQPA